MIRTFGISPKIDLIPLDIHENKEDKSHFFIHPLKQGVWWPNMCCDHMAPVFTKMSFDFFPTVTCSWGLGKNNGPGGV